MSFTFYDKSTCGTCKKAKNYLNDHQVAFETIDIINEPPSREFLEKHIDEKNLKAYLNSRSKPYREHKMSQNLPTKSKAIELMLQDPNLIKRPIIIRGEAVVFGFNEDEYQERLM